jgi:mono/diheme cytochrome c family protein
MRQVVSFRVCSSGQTGVDNTLYSRAMCLSMKMARALLSTINHGELCTVYMSASMYSLECGRVMTMKLLGSVLAAGWFVLSCSLLVLEGYAEQQFSATDVNAGRKCFVQYCSVCHGINGRGDGTAALAIRTPALDLTRIAQRRGGRFPEAEIAAHIDGSIVIRAHGSRDMPIWRRRFGEKFGGDSIGEEFGRGYLLILVDYLKSIQK